MLTDLRLVPGEDIAPQTSSAGSPWLAAARRLFGTWSRHRQDRLPKELAALPDYILVDIGVDPRRVPNPAGDMIPRPDLSRKGLATPIWRTTAKP